jgi:hypothetical protein
MTPRSTALRTFGLLLAGAALVELLARGSSHISPRGSGALLSLIGIGALALHVRVARNRPAWWGSEPDVDGQVAALGGLLVLVPGLTLLLYQPGSHQDHVSVGFVESDFASLRIAASDALLLTVVVACCVYGLSRYGRLVLAIGVALTAAWLLRWDTSGGDGVGAFSSSGGSTVRAVELAVAAAVACGGALAFRARRLRIVARSLSLGSGLLVVGAAFASPATRFGGSLAELVVDVCALAALAGLMAIAGGGVLGHVLVLAAFAVGHTLENRGASGLALALALGGAALVVAPFVLPPRAATVPRLLPRRERLPAPPT